MYKKASAPVPPAYKEEPPVDFREVEGWKQAAPADGVLKGKWWELYKDPTLNALEEQVSISNQNVLLAEAQYREARDAVRFAHSQLFPAASVGPAITESRTTGATAGAMVLHTSYSLPLDASWAPDLWGSVRRNLTAVTSDAQAVAAQLENIRLIYQSELAQDYFNLRGLDGEYELLDRTVKSYQEFLTLTRNRFSGGVASDLDVAQAESQLYTAQSDMTDLGVARAQYEHAIAVLTGKPPAELSLPVAALHATPPPVPIGVPSALLERRPDIAQSERQMAAANEQIGIARVAFYPSLTLSGTGGFSATTIGTWLSWPSRVFAIGPAAAETIFDAGRRRAAVAQVLDAYDASIAGYRQTVLTAFQQVEDNLAALRILANEAVTVDKAVSSSERALTVSTVQYKAGTVSYLTVITAQATALSAERTAVNLMTRRLVASVALIQALGGGWDVSQLPSQQDVRMKAPNG
jgi:NodT family efflux transporter outer membrane factor (OMF) lipoprotein